jgi:hypothetical protein
VVTAMTITIGRAAPVTSLPVSITARVPALAGRTRR